MEETDAVVMKLETYNELMKEKNRESELAVKFFGLQDYFLRKMAEREINEYTVINFPLEKLLSKNGVLSESYLTCYYLNLDVNLFQDYIRIRYYELEEEANKKANKEKKEESKE